MQIEYHVVKVSEDRKDVKVLLKAPEILEQLAKM
jgi:hypothetical protein